MWRWNPYWFLVCPNSHTWHEAGKLHVNRVGFSLGTLNHSCYLQTLCTREHPRWRISHHHYSKPVLISSNNLLQSIVNACPSILVAWTIWFYFLLWKVNVFNHDTVDLLFYTTMSSSRIDYGVKVLASYIASISIIY